MLTLDKSWFYHIWLWASDLTSPIPYKFNNSAHLICYIENEKKEGIYKALLVPGTWLAPDAHTLLYSLDHKHFSDFCAFF